MLISVYFSGFFSHDNFGCESLGGPGPRAEKGGCLGMCMLRFQSIGCIASL